LTTFRHPERATAEGAKKLGMSVYWKGYFITE